MQVEVEMSGSGHGTRQQIRFDDVKRWDRHQDGSVEFWGPGEDDALGLFAAGQWAFVRRLDAEK